MKRIIFQKKNKQIISVCNEKNWVQLLFILIILASTWSCKNTSKNGSPNEIVKQWMGKQVKFPNDTLCFELGRPVPCEKWKPNSYKILLYTDSFTCVSCNLRIDEWIRFMKSIDTSVAKKLDLAFYFSPKKEDNLPELFQKENFKQVVHIDRSDELNRLNRFPLQMEYQCFLLNPDNKVVLIGNPTLNEDIWKLYIKTINDSLGISKN